MRVGHCIGWTVAFLRIWAFAVRFRETDNSNLLRRQGLASASAATARHVSTTFWLPARSDWAWAECDSFLAWLAWLQPVRFGSFFACSRCSRLGISLPFRCQSALVAIASLNATELIDCEHWAPRDSHHHRDNPHLFLVQRGSTERYLADQHSCLSSSFSCSHPHRSYLASPGMGQSAQSDQTRPSLRLLARLYRLYSSHPSEVRLNDGQLDLDTKRPGMTQMEHRVQAFSGDGSRHAWAVPLESKGVARHQEVIFFLQDPRLNISRWSQRRSHFGPQSPQWEDGYLEGEESHPVPQTCSEAH